MTEFEVEGVNYRCRKMNGFTQLNIARRMIPILPSLKQTIEAVTQTSADGAEKGGDAFIDNLAPLAEAIAGLEDRDVNYVISACLGAVDRQAGPGWMPVWNTAAGRSQFDDVQTNGYLMLRLTAAVIQDNLMTFFPGLPSALSAGAGVSQASSPST